MTKNLWPDFETKPEIRTVRRILLEAGEGIAEKTDGQIQFQVESLPAENSKSKSFPRLIHTCYLFVPRLGYRYPLFRVVEEGDPYPVTLVGDGLPAGTEIAWSEEALLDHLQRLFHSEATKRAVQQLLDLLS